MIIYRVTTIEDQGEGNNKAISVKFVETAREGLDIVNNQTAKGNAATDEPIDVYR